MNQSQKEVFQHKPYYQEYQLDQQNQKLVQNENKNIFKQKQMTQQKNQNYQQLLENLYSKQNQDKKIFKNEQNSLDKQCQYSTQQQQLMNNSNNQAWQKKGTSYSLNQDIYNKENIRNYGKGEIFDKKQQDDQEDKIFQDKQMQQQFFDQQYKQNNMNTNDNEKLLKAFKNYSENEYSKTLNFECANNNEKLSKMLNQFLKQKAQNDIQQNTQNKQQQQNSQNQNADLKLQLLQKMQKISSRSSSMVSQDLITANNLKKQQILKQQQNQIDKKHDNLGLKQNFNLNLNLKLDKKLLNSLKNIQKIDQTNSQKNQVKLQLKKKHQRQPSQSFNTINNNNKEMHYDDKKESDQSGFQVEIKNLNQKLQRQIDGQQDKFYLNGLENLKFSQLSKIKRRKQQYDSVHRQKNMFFKRYKGHKSEFANFFWKNKQSYCEVNEDDGDDCSPLFCEEEIVNIKFPLQQFVNQNNFVSKNRENQIKMDAQKSQNQPKYQDYYLKSGEKKATQNQREILNDSMKWHKDFLQKSENQKSQQKQQNNLLNFQSEQLQRKKFYSTFQIDAKDYSEEIAQLSPNDNNYNKINTNIDSQINNNNNQNINFENDYKNINDYSKVVNDNNDQKDINNNINIKNEIQIEDKQFNRNEDFEWFNGEDLEILEINYQKQQNKWYQIKKQALQQSKEICWVMRAILIDWMMEVSMEFMMKRETFYIAVYLVDMLISVEQNIERSKLQLIGVVCLFIAAKIEEVFPPRLLDFVKSTDDGYKQEELEEMEYYICKWHLNPLTYNYQMGFYLQKWDKFLDYQLGLSLEQNEICDNQVKINPFFNILLQDLQNEKQEEFNFETINLAQFREEIKNLEGKFKFKNQSQQSYVNYRTIYQYLDLLQLDFSFYNLSQQKLIAALIYLIGGIMIELFQQKVIFEEFQHTSYFITGEEYAVYNEYYNKFLSGYFGMLLLDILPEIQSISQIFDSEINLDLPTGAIELDQENNNNNQKNYEEFLSFQPFYSNQIEYIKQKGQMFQQNELDQEQRVSLLDL
ncbi:Cyclin-like protein [Pseudocohnilembus persalinus]|uniref:Cyclin-like protein n=1 Tax=Pseudocohnilembus persalinus TaxID=266149 RepID=A0A0V0R213_PSEPJ|nr:Cyclin-like protein [Pseudocohnilembus persalinus]|eukprot:KRX08429.1 Cyclin-like protein [Pseudocohnilembus persalinus]